LEVVHEGMVSPVTRQVPYLPDLDPSHSPTAPATAITPQAPRRSLLARLRREDSGQDLIEYALTAAMVGLTVVSGMGNLAGNIANSFNSIGSAVSSAVPAGSSTGGSENSGDSNNNNGGNNSGGGHHGGGGHGGGFGGFHHH
jgi:pilus assembly protein Flp/PilA